MEVQDPLQLPENTCAYERYDPKTLIPQNAETFVRLQELGWSREDFEGRSVLDIGCNSGLLTIYALRLGAARVTALDVQPALVEFVSKVVQAHTLPVTVARTAFKDLEPATFKTDIVLFMEVLHWAVSQGLELRDVIRRLAELTGEILYIEFPWSVDEPSIQKQTKLTAATYSADAVLDELTRYFGNVRVVRFMRYFGFKSASRRVLIEARDKRPEADILAQLPDVYSLGLSLTRGRNESYLLASAQGPLVAKMLAREGTLFRMPEQLCDELFDEIRARRPTALILPEKVNGSYLLTSPGAKRWMIFLFIGQMPNEAHPPAPPTDFASLIDLFARVRSDLRHVSPDLVGALRRHRLHPKLESLASPAAPWAKNPGQLAEIRDPVLEALRMLPLPDSEAADSVCHGDLQTGNFVRDENGDIKVVDLDNFSVGPIYSDGLLGLMWRGAPSDVLSTFCEKLRPEEARSVNPSDIAVALAKGVAWFSAVRPQESEPVMREQISRLRQGLAAGLELMKSIGRAAQ